MATILKFATLHPIWFVLISMLVSFVLLMLVFILAQGVSKGREGAQMLALGTGQVLVGLAFLALIGGLGWWEAAGLRTFGAWRGWLVVLAGMVYLGGSGLYAYTGDLRLPIPDKKRAVRLAYQMLGGGLLEETVYRGLALYTFLRLWGDTGGGVFGSVGLSAALFGLSHMTWALFGKSLKLAALQSLGAILGGVIYGAIVVGVGSIWPVVLVHAGVNTVVNIKILPLTDYHETVAGGWRYVLLQVPAVVVSLTLLWQSVEPLNGCFFGEP